MPQNQPTKSVHEEGFFGSCSFSHTSRGKESLSKDASSLDVFLSFEAALKLNLALNEGLLKLNRYNKASKEGKRCALKITMHFGNSRILVNEATLQKECP